MGQQSGRNHRSGHSQRKSLQRLLSLRRVVSTTAAPGTEAALFLQGEKILTEGGLSPILAQMEAANLGSKLLTLFWGYNKELFSYGTKRKRTPNTQIKPH